MRFLLKITIPVEEGNAAIRDGSLPRTIESILADLKPEAAYFSDGDGKRAAYVFVDMQDPSQIPAMAEPWFLSFNAGVELHPVMNAQDLAKAGPGIEQAVKKHG